MTREGQKILASISLVLILGAFGSLLNGNVNAATLTILSVTPVSSSAGSLGENVSIQASVYSVSNLTGYSLQLRFNTTLLQCRNASIGSWFPGPPNSTSTVTIDNNQGIVSVQAYLQGNATPVSAVGLWPGTLLSVNFNATYATSYPWHSSSTLAITSDTLYGIGNQTIQYSLQNGTYTAPVAPPQLNITLNTKDLLLGTNGSNSYFEDPIYVNGTLTGNGYPIPDALVALEIQGPMGVPVVARTLQTSSMPVQYPLQITGVTPCDADGSPQNSFHIGSFVFFMVTINNSGSTDTISDVLVNPYDSSNSSLGVSSMGVIVPARSSTSLILGLPLQYDARPSFLTPATSGNATVYVSVWTDLLEYGGTPLAPENQATFTITGTAQGTPRITNPSPQGTYQAIFALHFIYGIYSSSPAQYTVYAEAEFMGNRVIKSQQMHMTLAGDINVDGKVSLADLVLLANSYNSKPGKPNWNPNADINQDGSVNLPDLVLLANNYGKGNIQ